MTSFARMILSLFALVVVLFAFALFFSPQVRNSFTNQAGESPVGQLKANAELVNPGQSGRLAPAGSDADGGTVSGTTTAPTSVVPVEAATPNP